VSNLIISFACFDSTYPLGNETEDGNGGNEQHQVVKLDNIKPIRIANS
jgi:hypothetical protein